MRLRRCRQRMSTDMYWDKLIETMDRESLERLQYARLTETLARAQQAPFYAALYGKNGVRGFSSLTELAHLPFTTKADLRDGFPYGFLAVPLERIRVAAKPASTAGNSAPCWAP